MKLSHALLTASVFSFLLFGDLSLKAKTGMGGDAFSIQILASSIPLQPTDAKLKVVKDVKEEIADGPLKYKYTTGKTTSFDEAASTRSKMIDAGFKDAFIVVYKDGKRITKKEATVRKNDELTASIQEEKPTQDKTQNTNAQESPEVKRGIGNSIVQHDPEFPGGQDSLSSFLFKNLRQPEKVTPKGQWKHEFVSFTVDKSGKIKDPKVLLSLSEKADAEALRIVGLMPDWKPATVDTMAVNKDYVLSIDFFVPDKE